MCLTAIVRRTPVPRHAETARDDTSIQSEKRRVPVRSSGTRLPRTTVHAPGSACGADAQGACRPSVSREPCSPSRPRLSTAAIIRQDRAPRRRPGPSAGAMASLDACIPQLGHKVKMHAWMGAARWRLGMPVPCLTGARSVPPAPRRVPRPACGVARSAAIRASAAGRSGVFTVSTAPLADGRIRRGKSRPR